MAAGQKANLDVRLLGLDEKANPRTAVAGTIVDGRNWTMDKDGRVKKRAGLTAAAMLDTDGAAITGGRELASLGEELALCTRDKVYGRDATSGAWAPRGRRAYESARICPAVATNAPCDGTDSFLQMDTATIGRYVLLLTSGGVEANSDSESGWMLVDGTSGACLQSKTALATGYYGVVASDTGEATPRFIAFAAERGTSNLRVAEWDSDHRGVTWSAMIDDMAIVAERPIYGMQPAGVQAAPYAICRTAANTWLIAYQDTGVNFVVRKLTRSGPNAFTLSAASSIENTIPSVALVPAIAYKAGTSTALVAGMYFGTIYYGTITISTMVVTGTGNVEPSQWTCTGAAPLDHPYCRGITATVVGTTAYFFFDVSVYTGSWSRSVWTWGLGAGPTMVARNSGLLCHAAQFSTAETGEIALGIAHLSSWQPSAAIMRLKVSGGVWDWMTIGAHLCAGDYAGRGMRTLLPQLTSNALALGILNEPISPGGPGTTLVKIATIGYADTSTACSQPAEIGGSLLLPGACLKAYDGQHVTEAAFPLGPDSLAAPESAIGNTFGAINTPGSVITGDLTPYASVIGDNIGNPVLSSSLISVSFSVGVATIPLRTVAGYPGYTPWPAGTVSINVWVRIVDPVAGHNYVLERGSSSSDYKIRTSETHHAWQSGDVADVVLTDEWQQVIWSVSVASLATATTADRLEVLIDAASDDTTAGETALFQLAIGGTMPVTISAPFAVIEAGTRLYRACLAWTDSQGRKQRSQICPAVTSTNTGGRTNAVTIPMTTITERSPVTNLDFLIHPAVIEVYRTEVLGTTYYLVGHVSNVPNAAAAVLYDRLTDVALVANEQLYTTGGTVDHWPPIGANIVASHQGRAFVATIDNQILFSAYASAGEGLAFAAEFLVETSHLPGVLTALISLDDKLGICTANAVASLAGVGPELTGTPAYDSPMVIGTKFGPVSPRALTRVPTGVAMITAHGVYMLDRGLGLQWTGAAVNDDVPGSYAWTAATYTPGGDQIRFSTTGLVLVHDLTLPGPPNRAGQWMRWTYPTNVWAWATMGGVLYQLNSNGLVYQADTGLSDYGAAFQEWIQLSVISPTGPNGWARIYAAELTCDVVTGTTIKIAFTNDDFSLAENATLLAGPKKHVVAKPQYGQAARMTIWIGENAATSTAGIALDAIGLSVATKGGLGRLGPTNRAARST
jgi:hypothetical protein